MSPPRRPSAGRCPRLGSPSGLAATCGLLGVAAVALALLAASCSSDEKTTGSSRADLTIRGDSVVVRTRAGSVWGVEATLVPEVSIGEAQGDPDYVFKSVISLDVGLDGTIYVASNEPAEVRAYAPDGRFLRRLGRPGQGRGELYRPDGGLAVLSDDRVLVRDPGNSRIQPYGADGKALSAWSLPAGMVTRQPLFRDRGDNVYTQIVLDQSLETGEWRSGVVRISPKGEYGDTLTPPTSRYIGDVLVVSMREQGDRQVRLSVPFGPTGVYTVHPDGYLVDGVGDAYRFTLLRPEHPLIVERVAEAAPVAAWEKRAIEELVTHEARRFQPDWEWNGPPVPDRKPFFTGLHAGRDGRIWVEIPLPAVEVEGATYDPGDPDSAMRLARTQRYALDVFEPDGTYLGRIQELPRFYAVEPVFDGDRLWAVTLDDAGVQRVVRFRVERAAAQP